MNEDELRDRLGRIDPVPDQMAMEPATAPSSRDRLERIMHTEPSTDIPNRRNPGRRPPTVWLAAAAVVLVAIIGAGVFALARDDSGPDEVASAPLELTLGDGGATASCLALDVDILAGMSPAFSATATQVGGDRVTLEVDRWFVGGDAEVVELSAQSGLAGLIAGFEFEVGGQYLVTASGGAVNYCGYTGPATPELTALFEQAFGG